MFHENYAEEDFNRPVMRSDDCLPGVQRRQPVNLTRLFRPLIHHLLNGDSTQKEREREREREDKSFINCQRRLYLTPFRFCLFTTCTLTPRISTRSTVVPARIDLTHGGPNRGTD